MNAQDRALLNLLLNTPAKDEVRTALAAAHRETAVLRSLPAALLSVQSDATITIEEGHSIDCSEPLETGWEIGLNSHDRAVVAAFIATLEGRIAQTIASLGKPTP